MWEWIARSLIALCWLVSIFCFTLAAFKSTTDYAKAACIVAAMAALVRLIKLEVQVKFQL